MLSLVFHHDDDQCYCSSTVDLVRVLVHFLLQTSICIETDLAIEIANMRKNKIVVHFEYFWSLIKNAIGLLLIK